MKLSTKLTIGAAGLALGGSGIITGVVLASGSSSPTPPAVVQPVIHSDVTDTTTSTTVDATTTTTAAPTTTVAPVPTTTVARQAPATTVAPVTTTTTLDPNVTVPNVVGDTFGQATSVITAAGLHVGNLGCVTASGTDDPSQIVTSQGPAAGQTLRRGNQVMVQCAGGPTHGS